MNSRAEIEAAITHLSQTEAHQLLNWLQNYLDDAWDEKIKTDASSGRLDKLIQRAKADIKANRVKSLDEVIDNLRDGVSGISDRNITHLFRWAIDR